MAHNTEYILKLISDRPDIRLVEIADQADCDPEQVMWALKDALHRGEVVQKEILAPNGRRQPSFRMKNAPATPVQVPKFIQPAPPVPAAIPQDIAQPVAATPPKRNKPDLAIDYLQQHGSASNATLSAVMGLNKGSYPSQFLTHAVRRKVVRLQNGTWYLCSSEKAETADTAETAKPVKQVPAGTDSIPPASTESITTNTTVTKQIQPQNNDRFSCAIWSHDEALRLYRGDNLIAELSRTEVNQLVQFQARFSQLPGAAA